MEELSMNKLSESELAEATGGVEVHKKLRVISISPIWIKVTASSLNCRYSPNGEVAKIYTKGHRLQVNGVTRDGKWYRLLIYDPRNPGGTCDGYIAKKYTKLDK